MGRLVPFPEVSNGIWTAPPGAHLREVRASRLLNLVDLMRRVDPPFVSAVFELLDFSSRVAGTVSVIKEVGARSAKIRHALQQAASEGAQTVIATIDRAGLTFFADECQKHGLPVTGEKVTKILYDGRGRRHIDMSRYVPEVTDTLRSELGQVVFFMVKKEQAVYYDCPDHFGAAAMRRFPRAIADMEEAGNCRTLERPTACVFHLMRVMEHALRALGRVLKVKDPAGTARRSWAKCIDEMQGKVDAKIAADPNWKKHPHYRFWTNALGLLDTVRLRWRNRCMHVDRTYSETEAARVYEAVCEFADCLAEIPRLL